MNQKRKQGQQALNKDRRRDTEYGVLDGVVRGSEVDDTKKENNNIVPTGNLTEEGYRLLLRYQDILEGARKIEDVIGEDVELGVKDRIIEKINFLVHSSKSIEGFGIEKIATKELRESQSVRHEDSRRDQKGVVDEIREQVKQNMGGGGGGNYAAGPDEDIW